MVGTRTHHSKVEVLSLDVSMTVYMNKIQKMAVVLLWVPGEIYVGRWMTTCTTL